jgi:hypothetical protein
MPVQGYHIKEYSSNTAAHRKGHPSGGLTPN